MDRPSERWSDNNHRNRSLWNPRSPDNMLVRHISILAGEADPDSVPERQRKVARLAGKRQSTMVPPPSDDEYTDFLAKCEEAGMFDSSGDE